MKSKGLRISNVHRSADSQHISKSEIFAVASDRNAITGLYVTDGCDRGLDGNQAFEDGINFTVVSVWLSDQAGTLIGPVYCCIHIQRRVNTHIYIYPKFFCFTLFDNEAVSDIAFQEAYLVLLSAGNWGCRPAMG